MFLNASVCVWSRVEIRHQLHPLDTLYNMFIVTESPGSLPDNTLIPLDDSWVVTCVLWVKVLSNAIHRILAYLCRWSVYNLVPLYRQSVYTIYFYHLQSSGQMSGNIPTPAWPHDILNSLQTSTTQDILNDPSLNLLCLGLFSAFLCTWLTSYSWCSGNYFYQYSLVICCHSNFISCF